MRNPTEDSIWRTMHESNLQVHYRLIPQPLRTLLKPYLDDDGYFRMGRIPKGTFINLPGNTDPDADPVHFALLLLKIKKVMLEIRLKNLDPAEAKELMHDHLPADLFKASKCFDRMEAPRGFKQSRLLAIWELFSFILPGKTRRECFEPDYNDLIKVYVQARKFRGKWACRWIAFAFTVRTLLMVTDCFRVLLQSGAGRFILGLFPESARNWWRRQ